MSTRYRIVSNVQMRVPARGYVVHGSWLQCVIMTRVDEAYASVVLPMADWQLGLYLPGPVTC
jgi:hypothetical protein